jgi:uncharacterized protein YidB (DUF937 family)
VGGSRRKVLQAILGQRQSGCRIIPQDVRPFLSAASKSLVPIAIPRFDFDEKICAGGHKMGFLDDLVTKVADSFKGSEAQGGLVEGVMGLLTNRETGGLGGLVQAFNEQGLGNIISSWVGTGQNAAITPDQVQEVLGSDVIQQLAEKSGFSVDAARAQLAELLPRLVDQVTPEGKIPAGSLLDTAREALQNIFPK